MCRNCILRADTWSMVTQNSFKALCFQNAATTHSTQNMKLPTVLSVWTRSDFSFISPYKCSTLPRPPHNKDTNPRLIITHSTAPTELHKSTPEQKSPDPRSCSSDCRFQVHPHRWSQSSQMRVQTNTLLRFKVFDQDMYKIRIPSVFSPVSKPIVINLRSGVNTRCARECNRMRCSALQNAKRKETNGNCF